MKKDNVGERSNRLDERERERRERERRESERREDLEEQRVDPSDGKMPSEL